MVVLAARVYAGVVTLFHEIMPLRDFRGKLLGKFSGSSFIATYRDGAKSAVVRWSSPESDPDLITPIDGAVVGLDVSADGRRLALAVVRPANPQFLASQDPALLLELDLDPLSGHMLVAPGAAARFGADILRPTICWSKDGPSRL